MSFSLHLLSGYDFFVGYEKKKRLKYAKMLKLVEKIKIKNFGSSICKL